MAGAQSQALGVAAFFNPPLVAGAAPRFTAPPLAVAAAPLFAGLGLGGLDTKVAVRAFEILEAVGLLNLSAAPGPKLIFFTGGGGSGIFPALASEAAVGAKSREEGVLGREGVAREDGVFGREDEGVLGRTVEGVLGRDGVGGVGRCDALELGRGFAVPA